MIQVLMTTLSGIVRTAKMTGSSTPGMAGWIGAAPGESTSAS
jgi:hypothetical protein